MNNPSTSSRLEWAESYARLLDSRFRVPGTRFTFGLDPIIGLVPGLGDALSMGFQLLLAYTLIREGSSGKLRALLIINVLLDTSIGSIPVVGQVFDFFFKASQRNLKLTREYLYEGKHRGSGKAIWLGVLGLFILTLIVIGYVIVWIIQQIIELFH